MGAGRLGGWGACAQGGAWRALQFPRPALTMDGDASLRKETEEVGYDESAGGEGSHRRGDNRSRIPCDGRAGLRRGRRGVVRQVHHPLELGLWMLSTNAFAEELGADAMVGDGLQGPRTIPIAYGHPIWPAGPARLA